MDKLSEYLRVIAATCPELVLNTARLHTSDGQFNDIVFVNEDLIFRFPRSPEVAGPYVQQVVLLRYLQGRLPLPIPTPLYTSQPDVPWQQCFIAYRLIPGQPLFRETLAALDDQAAVQAMAAQLAEFLRSLHQLPVAQLPVALPVNDTLDEWAALYAGFQAKLFPFMRPDARQAVREHFERYLQDPARLTFRPVLRHGDFGGTNILYDPQARRVSGVIDFESLSVGDPAADAAALSTYGEPFFGYCLVHYPGLQGMLERARFYRGTFALQEAYYGLRDGDQEAFERGIADYT